MRVDIKDSDGTIVGYYEVIKKREITVSKIGCPMTKTACLGNFEPQQLAELILAELSGIVVKR